MNMQDAQFCKGRCRHRLGDVRTFRDDGLQVKQKRQTNRNAGIFEFRSSEGTSPWISADIPCLDQTFWNEVPATPGIVAVTTDNHAKLGHSRVRREGGIPIADRSIVTCGMTRLICPVKECQPKNIQYSDDTWENEWGRRQGLIYCCDDLQ